MDSGMRRAHRGTEVGRGECEPALNPQQFREDLCGKAKVRTGLRKTDRPGSQGGSGKHRPKGELGTHSTIERVEVETLSLKCCAPSSIPTTLNF